MKKQVVKTLTQISLLAVIATVAAVGSAQGQSPANAIRADIPFDFTVADKKLPAGDYSIRRLQQEIGDSVLVVSSANGRLNALRLTGPVDTQSPKDKETLVFHRYGDQYFLSEVWPAGATTGRIFSESRGEREAKARSLPDKIATNVGTVMVIGSR